MEILLWYTVFNNLRDHPFHLLEIKALAVTKYYFQNWTNKRHPDVILNCLGYNTVFLSFRLTAREKFVMKINVIRTKLKAFMLSSFMYWVVIFVVFLNSLSGIIQHYGQPQWISDIIGE